MIVITVIICFSVAPAFAVGLTESDYAYLETQDVQRNSTLIKSLSPKEQARIHALINDQMTKNDPVTHAQNVNQALAQFGLNQIWELENQGQPWKPLKN